MKRTDLQEVSNDNTALPLRPGPLGTPKQNAPKLPSARSARQAANCHAGPIICRHPTELYQCTSYNVRETHELLGCCNTATSSVSARRRLLASWMSRPLHGVNNRRWWRRAIDDLFSSWRGLRGLSRMVEGAMALPLPSRMRSRCKPRVVGRSWLQAVNNISSYWTFEVLKL
jgi:hypothetical protein